MGTRNSLLLGLILALSFNLQGQVPFQVSWSFSSTGTGIHNSRTHLMMQLDPKLNESERQAIFQLCSECNVPGPEAPQAFPGLYLISLKKEIGPKAYTNLLGTLQSIAGVQYAKPVGENAEGEWLGMTDRIWVELGNEVGLGDFQARLRQTDANLSLEKVNEFDRDFVLVKTGKSATWLVAREIATWNGVRSAEPDFLFSPVVTTNDTYFSYQWSIKNNGTSQQGSGTAGADMNVEAAWNYTTGDPGTIVAILDSGTDTLHPDLMPNLLPGFDATGNGSKGYPNTNYEEDGHGTACAGIVGAKGDNGIGIAGICYDCNLLPIKVFYYINDSFFGIMPWSTGTWMSDAINWAEQNDADVMSNSWGIPDVLMQLLPGGTSIVNSAMADAATNGRNGLGTPLFFSSGNDGGKPIWPGRSASAICVNATTMCDERKHPGSCDGESWEGNWRDSVDIGAPGVRVMTTDMTDTLGYTITDYNTQFNGTSAACPNAAGVMGLILSQDPSLSAKTARKYLETTCDKIGGYSYYKNKGNGTWSNELGFGRINAGAALLATSRTDELRVLDFSCTLFPNPAKDQVWLQVRTERMGSGRYRLLDLTGRSLFISAELNFGQGSQVVEVDGVKELAAGLYLLELEIDGKRLSRRLVIE